MLSRVARAPATQPAHMRSGLFLAPMPGTTVEVFAGALGLPGTMLVATCVGAACALALCRHTGRICVVLRADDVLWITRGGEPYMIKAGWSSLPAAGPGLIMICEPVHPATP